MPDGGFAKVITGPYGGSEFAAAEEIFTRFEHHAALAQLALEELHDHLARIRAAASEASNRPVSGHQ